MIIPKSLKLNRFKQVPIPSNKDYFGRCTAHTIPAKSMYSGDEHIPLAETKVQSLSRTEKLVEEMSKTS